MESEMGSGIKIKGCIDEKSIHPYSGVFQATIVMLLSRHQIS